MDKLTCFVISPIGKEGSQTRQDADDFLKYLLEPALEKYSFRVIRADKIPKPTVITSDIIRLVQESDLCIIDITNSNPNVFYECGRRHETGRPFIQMIKAGASADIPFDVAGIRTLEYDLSDIAKAHKSIKELQLYVDGFINTGFGERAAGHTMASLGEAIDRMERKLNKMSFSTPGSSTSVVNNETDVEIMLSHPVEAFHRLLRKGDLEGAFAVLDSVRSAAGSEQYIAGLATLATARHEKSVEYLLEEITRAIASNELSKKDVELAGYGLRGFYIHSGQGKQGVAVIGEIFNKMKNSNDVDNEILATFSNIVQMCAWASDDYQSAIHYGEETVLLRPDVNSFWYNLALNYEQVQDENNLLRCLRKLATFDDLDEDHLSILTRHGLQHDR
jgi:tetratricopeptide (TPR) repeat protein